MPGPFYFAWAGGTIADPVQIITTGNTHGGSVTSTAVAADTRNGRNNLFNLSSNSGLDEAALYKCEGPGILPNTHFLYDTSVLIGEPGSVNLTEVTPNDVLSGTFVLTRAIALGQWAASVVQNATSINFGAPLDLAAGLYAIAGDPIGITAVPVGTTVGGSGTTTSGSPALTSVPSAMFEYDGTGTSISLFVMAATPHTVTGTDSGGQPTSHTTWDVDRQAVHLNATGTFGFEISGMPDSDWYAVTGIPAGALSGLTAALRYNISGSGIPVGTTFLAPDPGATSIELDQPAAASAQGSILTITGPRTPNAPFDPSIHDRFDEEVLSIELSQDEGGFATLNVELKTQAIGYLATGRQLWCWLSYDPNWGSADPPALQPIFNGRLVGVPQIATNEVVQLQFLARPDDYIGQKLALAESMSVLPFYDPVFLTEQSGSPDTVLEAYSALWHIDRTSLELSASDILAGEDGTVVIGEDQAFYDSFAQSFGQGAAPMRQVAVSATVSWVQEGEGLIDVTRHLTHAFRDAGNFSSLPFSGPRPFQITNVQSGGALISSLNGEGLRNSWPKPGTGIGGGWAVATGNDANGQPFSYMLDATQPLGWLPGYFINVTYTGALAPTAPPSNFNVAMTGLGIWTYTFALNYYKIRMMLDYHASRKRTETVRAVLVSDVQDEIPDSTASEPEELSLTSDFVANGIDPGGGIPIGSPLYRSYFQTDRGAGSFEYLLLLARAKLRSAARSVDVSFAVDFATALGIGLRNSVALFDRRLPGGSATGKVKHYRITVGEAGMWGEFTIGCSIGNGQPVSAAEGINAYVDDGYVEPGYQVVAGAQHMLLTDELAYQTLDNFLIVDDGLDLANFSADQAVNFCTVTNGLTVQLPELQKFGAIVPVQTGNPFDATKNLKTTVTLDMKPVTGAEYHTEFLPAVSLLAIPKTIDLAAE